MSRTKVEKVAITCDICQREIPRPVTGLEIMLGDVQPDHRIPVTFHLLEGDLDVCRVCLKDAFANGLSGVKIID